MPLCVCLAPKRFPFHPPRPLLRRVGVGVGVGLVGWVLWNIFGKIFYSFTHLMNYDEGPYPRHPIPHCHGIEISTLFDFIELFLLTFASVAIYCLSFLLYQGLSGRFRPFPGSSVLMIISWHFANEKEAKMFCNCRENRRNVGVYLCIFVRAVNKNGTHTLTST